MADISETTVTMTSDYTPPGATGWWVNTRIVAGGEVFITYLFIVDDEDAQSYQGLVDGVPGASADNASLDTETDQLMFQCSGPRTVAVARALVAPQLATVLGLRQPSDLGAKPAKV